VIVYLAQAKSESYIPLSPWYTGIPTCFDLVWFRHLFHRSCFKSIDSALGRTLIRSVLGIEASMCPEGLSFALSNQSSVDQRDERWEMVYYRWPSLLTQYIYLAITSIELIAINPFTRNNTTDSIPSFASMLHPHSEGKILPTPKHPLDPLTPDEVSPKIGAISRPIYLVY